MYPNPNSQKQVIASPKKTRGISIKNNDARRKISNRRLYARAQKKTAYTITHHPERILCTPP